MKQNVKRFIVPAAKVLLFVFLFASLYTYSREVLRDKTSSGVLRTIMERPNDTYDVILCGPSHIQMAIQPAQLFGEYGISSCNTATAAQSIPTSYYVIKEMIDRHDPELVVLDLFCLFYPDAYFSPARFHQVIDNFPLSRNKIEAVLDLGGDNKDEYLINYLLYHGRWKTLTAYDFSDPAELTETYQLLYETMPYPQPFAPVDIRETAEIPEMPLTYLKKIVDLCKATDTQLLLTVIPYRADFNNNDTSAVLQQQMYNTAAQLAREWDVDFLNGLHCLEEMGFDFSTDMAEYSHVNVSGSYKISAFYGKYLAEHYSLPNHYDDPDFAGWHDDYASYLWEVTNWQSAES